MCALPVAGCGGGSTADSGVVDSGGGTDSGGVDSGGGDGGSTLYTRLGGHAGIASAVDAIVAQEVMDPDIASYFFAQTAMPTPAGHPTLAQLKACLVNQLGNAAGGPEPYPGAPSDAMGWQCRDMATTHAGLGIPGGVFDHFVQIAAGVLMTAGVAADDIATIGTVLNSTRPQIVTDNTRDGGPFLGDASADH